ncbi:response regulator [Aquincola sp. S2]|uniref:histidine kinase n=1 Tax=Pseudaquabacterium terrae TaxID=2732868 RepID=A0ABX2EGS6_9BURK|nr:response regulator [Aquabacterium terrae]
MLFWLPVAAVTAFGAQEATPTVCLADQCQVQLKEAENQLLQSRQKAVEAHHREAEARRLALIFAIMMIAAVLAGLALYLGRRAAAARVRSRHLQAQADAAAEAGRAKGAFLANMNHELRSPLNAMLGFSRLLMAEPSLSARVRQDVAIILRSGEHLYALINQMLEISKIEAGRLGLDLVQFDLYALLEELEESFSLGARQKGLQLLVGAAGTVPRHVKTDVVKLRQVLTNLLTNAIKFTATGSVALQVEARFHAERTHLSFSVTDTGVGVGSEEVRKLDGTFMQAQAGRHSAESTGFGLSVTRSFVQLLGGELRVTSQAGHGTTVQFELPVEVVAGARAAGAHDSPRRRVTGIAEGQRGVRILAVDDWPEGRQLLVRLLEPLGFEVREAADGLQAVEACEQWSPHLVCMDMRMPVMNGQEATRRIKAQPGGERIVIVALTASSFGEEREAILACGCDDFLRKPFREEALLELLARHLGVRYEYETLLPEREDETPRASMAALPGPLREALGEALGRLDVDAIERAIDAVTSHDEKLGRRMAELAGLFDYDRLRKMLEAAPREGAA